MRRFIIALTLLTGCSEAADPDQLRIIVVWDGVQYFQQIPKMESLAFLRPASDQEGFNEPTIFVPKAAPRDISIPTVAEWRQQLAIIK